MGTQNQTPNTQKPGSGAQPRDPKSEQRAKGKDAGNVPRTDDDVIDESNQGTREDAAGTDVRTDTGRGTS
ncbi:MAG TPA: hypothetical protein VG994_12790 [Steroidobacteraceae bacterium]|nr:hypothetical protein [Steroidobacteraceae bacterium]